MQAWTPSGSRLERILGPGRVAEVSGCSHNTQGSTHTRALYSRSHHTHTYHTFTPHIPTPPFSYPQQHTPVPETWEAGGGVSLRLTCSTPAETQEELLAQITSLPARSPCVGAEVVRT